MVTPDSSQSLPSLKVLRCLSFMFSISDTQLSCSLARHSRRFSYQKHEVMKDPTTPYPKVGFGLFPFRSSLTQGISFDLFSSPYLDISVQEVTPHPINWDGSHISRYEGLPHSDTAGSMLRDSSPTTFVVMYVLLRHSMPRHPRLGGRP